MSDSPGIFDSSNNSKRAVIVRNISVLLFGISFMAGTFWANHISLQEILWRYWGWTILGGLTFLVFFPLVTYAGILMMGASRFGLLGFILGAVLMLVFFFLRSMAFAVIVYKHRKKDQKWGKNEHASDAAYQGLIGGSPSKGTGFWSLPIKIGSSSGSGGGSRSSGGGRFGGGGAGGRY